MNELISYRSVNGLKFGDSPERAEELFGKAGLNQRNQEGELEMFYENLILRFSQGTEIFRECTVPFNVQTQLNGQNVDWSVAGLKSICEADGEPMEFYGTVILFNQGVALTGIEEGAESDRTVTIFNLGDWDAFRKGMKPFFGGLPD